MLQADSDEVVNDFFSSSLVFTAAGIAIPIHRRLGRFALESLPPMNSHVASPSCKYRHQVSNSL